MTGGGASIWRLMKRKFITHQKSTMTKPMDCFTSMPQVGYGKGLVETDQSK
jgi:hypothetical protein